MKHLICALSLLFFSVIVFGQYADPENSAVIKGWTVLAESKTMVDFSYRIIQCEKKQVHLSVFNENAKDQQPTFKVTITDIASKKSFSKDVTMSIKAADIIKAECLPDPKTASLKFDIPEGYDPKHLKITVTF
jgi:hypothetical protein